MEEDGIETEGVLAGDGMERLNGNLIGVGPKVGVRDEPKTGVELDDDDEDELV